MSLRPSLPLAIPLLALGLFAAPAVAADGGDVIHVGFAEDVAPQYVASVLAALPPAPEFVPGAGWNAAGAPIVLTWSFVPDGLNIPAAFAGDPAGPSELFSRMDTLFASQGGRATWIGRMQSSFDRWQEFSGVTFVRLAQPGVDWDDGAAFGASGNGVSRGDIRISMRNIDGPNFVNHYAFGPTNGDVVMDRAESWASTTNAHRFLRNALSQSIGYSIGLRSVCAQDSVQLMELILQGIEDGPRQDDVRAAQFLYGDRNEPDDSPAAATPLPFVLGTTSVFGTPSSPPAGASDPFSSVLSIDTHGESDWFQLSVLQSAELDVAVTPVGSTYLESTPNSNGSCPAGSPTNALAAANLALEVYASDGTTLIASSSAAAAGLPESLVDVPLSTPGDYYVRVLEANTATRPQLYSLSIRVDPVSGCPDSDGDGLDDCIDNCPSIANSTQADCDLDGVGDACEIAAGTQWDANLNGIPDQCETCPNVATYCTPGLSSNGCTPTISTSGSPSVSATSGFTITVDNVEGQKSGLLFYSASGPTSVTWASGSSSFLCVAPPRQRTGVQNSGGSTGACDGSLSLDILDYWSTHPAALGQPIGANQLFNVQAWYRDPGAPSSTNLSGGVQFMTCP